MINYDISLIEIEIEKLYFMLGLTIFILIIMCIVIKNMWEAHENTVIMVEKINRDNELKYENLVNVVCPHEIKKYECEKCKNCISKDNKKECWKEYFINRIGGV